MQIQIASAIVEVTLTKFFKVIGCSRCLSKDTLLVDLHLFIT